MYIPEDADVLVDNMSTGATLKAAGLVVVETLATSSTQFAAHPGTLQVPAKAFAAKHLCLLLKSVLDARGKQLIEFNIGAQDLERIVDALPAMRAPTISPLYHGVGHAVKLVMPRKDVPKWIGIISAAGGSDILVTNLQQIVV